jgi:hypothetical protein
VSQDDVQQPGRLGETRAVESCLIQRHEAVSEASVIIKVGVELRDAGAVGV